MDLHATSGQRGVQPAQAACHGFAWTCKPPEKRKVGSSILPLTTTLTCADVHLVIVKVQVIALVAHF